MEIHSYFSRFVFTIYLFPFFSGMLAPERMPSVQCHGYRKHQVSSFCWWQTMRINVKAAGLFRAQAVHGKKLPLGRTDVQRILECKDEWLLTVLLTVLLKLPKSGMLIRSTLQDLTRSWWWDSDKDLGSGANNVTIISNPVGFSRHHDNIFIYFLSSDPHKNPSRQVSSL